MIGQLCQQSGNCTTGECRGTLSLSVHRKAVSAFEVLLDQPVNERGEFLTCPREDELRHRLIPVEFEARG